MFWGVSRRRKPQGRCHVLVSGPPPPQVRIPPNDLATATAAANQAVIDDPPDWTLIDDLGDDDIHSNAPGYSHFFWNPSDIDDGYRELQYVAIGSIAVGFGGAALLKIAALAERRSQACWSGDANM